MTADFNFDSLKANGFTNTLTNRGANKRSGVSYDYMDKLNVLVDQGIFYDKDGDGFTNAEKRALEDEFIKLHTEKGYKTNFKTMQAGTSNDYTFEDFVRLAQAAGYIMKEQPAAEVVDTEAPAAVEEEAPAEVEEEAPAEVEEEEGNEVISQSGKAILAQIVAQLPDRNGVEATIDFSGTSATDEQTGEVVYQKGSATVTYADGQTIKVKIDTDKKGNQTVTVEPSNDIAGAPVARAVETPVAVEEEAPAAVEEEAPAAVEEEAPAAVEEEAPAAVEEEAPEAGAYKAALNDDPEFAALSYDEKLQTMQNMQIDIEQQIKDAKRTTYTTTKKSGFLGLGKKKSVQVAYSADEIAQRQQGLPELEAQLDELNKQKVFIKETEGEYWGGKQSPDYTLDKNGNAIKRSNAYIRVTTADGSRLTKVGTYNSETHDYDYRYYTPTVAKTGNPEIYQATYYTVVPDFDNEVTDIVEARE